MDWVQLILIAVSLSMDAFAVALCKGLCMKRINYRHASVIALAFGLFQAIMPLIGWFLGKQFERFITPIDHWIAFVLLAYIGGKMIWDALHEDNEGQACDIEERLDLKELLVMAVATSIDALAVGITFAFLQISILPSVCAIGLITLGLSFVGVIIGNRFGNKFQSKAQLAGGTVLVLIGLRILLEHLGILVL